MNTCSVVVDLANLTQISPKKKHWTKKLVNLMAVRPQHLILQDLHNQDLARGQWALRLRHLHLKRLRMQPLLMKVQPNKVGRVDYRLDPRPSVTVVPVKEEELLYLIMKVV